MIARRPALASVLSLALAALALAPSIALADTPDAAPSTLAASMNGVRWLHRQIELQDGRVLVLGGAEGAATTAEVYDPAADVWTPTPPMLYLHNWPVAARLCDGRVLVTGRVDGAAKEAEIYDPVTNTWIPAGNMKFSHLYGTATLLTDCRVLFVGGYSANMRAEIYDPATGGFTTVKNFMTNERFFHATLALPEGRAIAIGGGVDANGTWYDHPSVDVFDPAATKWIQVAPLNAARRAHTATVLPDGRILVAGGTRGGKNNGSQGGVQLGSSEIYDFATNTWQEVETPLVTARTFHTATLMPNGAVLLFGGRDATASVTSSVEGFFDGAWQPLPPLLVDRYLHGSSLLADGRVFLTGGVHQATTERYALAPPGGACTTDLQCAAGHCVSGLCCDEACDTGCRRCDLPGKQGTCSVACASDTHALVCPDGSSTCPNEACVEDPCGEYLCEANQGVCLDACQSVAECAPGYACGLDHQCVLPPDVSAVDAESCALKLPLTGDSRSPRQALWLAALLLGLLRISRRNR